jgi:hypothetical protein
MIYDIIIVGAGISGLYSAYNIQKISPKTSFVILESNKREWIGGRIGTKKFYGVDVVVGAGVGRKYKDYLLTQLLDELHVPFHDCPPKMNYTFTNVDINKIITFLRKKYKESNYGHFETFKTFATHYLGEKIYKEFLVSAGYTDYENADVYETLYKYGMDDNTYKWTALKVPWNILVDKIVDKIGSKNIKPSNGVVSISNGKDENNNCLFELKTDKNVIYHCRKVIVATRISTLRKIVPGASDKNSIYQQIQGQPFLRLYAKFPKKSADIMKKLVPHYTIVTGPLQKIIPMDKTKGVYMIAYSDNASAEYLKKYKDNTPENCAFFSELLEKTFGLEKNTLTITALSDYYWPIGTHYYKPLEKGSILTRNKFIKIAQHPMPGMLVVGELVSRRQGWVEGALESVDAVLNKSWITKHC